MTEEGELIKYDRLLETEKKGVDVMLHNQVKSAIPNHWKAILRAKGNVLDGKTKWEQIESSKYPSREIYWQYGENFQKFQASLVLINGT